MVKPQPGVTWQIQFEILSERSAMRLQSSLRMPTKNTSFKCFAWQRTGTSGAVQGAFAVTIADTLVMVAMFYGRADSVDQLPLVDSTRSADWGGHCSAYASRLHDDPSVNASIRSVTIGSLRRALLCDPTRSVFGSAGRPSPGF